MIKKKVVFYGKVMEETMLIGHGLGFSREFQLGQEYKHEPTYNNKLYRYDRVAKQEIFFEDATAFDFEVGWKVRLGKEVVVIEDVINQVDGTVEYYTNKILRTIQVSPESILIPQEEVKGARRESLISGLVSHAKEYGIEVYEGELNGIKVYQIHEDKKIGKNLNSDEFADEIIEKLKEKGCPINV